MIIRLAVSSGSKKLSLYYRSTQNLRIQICSYSAVSMRSVASERNAIAIAETVLIVLFIRNHDNPSQNKAAALLNTLYHSVHSASIPNIRNYTIIVKFLYKNMIYL